MTINTYQHKVEFRTRPDRSWNSCHFCEHFFNGAEPRRPFSPLSVFTRSVLHMYSMSALDAAEVVGGEIEHEVGYPTDEETDTDTELEDNTPDGDTNRNCKSSGAGQAPKRG